MVFSLYDLSLYDLFLVYFPNPEISFANCANILIHLQYLHTGSARLSYKGKGMYSLLYIPTYIYISLYIPIYFYIFLYISIYSNLLTVSSSFSPRPVLPLILRPYPVLPRADSDHFCQSDRKLRSVCKSVCADPAS